MKNLELQKYLQTYPDDMPIKLLTDHEHSTKAKDFDYENVYRTADTAYVNDDAPYDEWDCEDGKVELGDGEQYLLINPIIV